MATPDRTALLTKIAAAPELPSPSGVALRIIRLTREEDVPLQRLEEVIRTDPAFVARLLRVANTGRAMLGARPIVAVREALLVLGLPAIRGMAIGFSLFDQHAQGACRPFDYQKFWTRSLLVAQAFQVIVGQIKAAPVDEAFSIGLLSNIGALTLATVFPEAYGRLLDEAGRNASKSLEMLEREALGLDQWELAAELMAHWGLPEIYAQPVARHRDHESGLLTVGSRPYLLANALALASVMADLILEPGHRSPEKIGELYRYGARVSLESSQLVDHGKAIAVAFQNWLDLLNLPSPGTVDFNWVAEATQRPEVLSQIVVDEVGNFNLLLVEDDRATRAYLAELLGKAGYRVLAAENGEQALEMASENPPDLILTDWVMPGMDGIELIRTLRSKPWGNRVYMLVITARSEEDHLVEAFDAGTNDYITKPIKSRVLLARLKAGERMIRLQRETERQYEEMREIASELSTSNRRLQELSVTDVLTGCPNRRYAIERLQQEWSAAERRGAPLSCLVVDVDWFKQVNDLYGHERGDEVLRLIADTLRAGVRAQDVVCRVGGDEFWVLCPNSGKDAAETCALRLCEAVEALRIKAGDHQCTVSIGVAERLPGMASPDALIEAADRQLYRAKREGRARVRY